MPLRNKIETTNGKTVTSQSTVEELLDVLVDWYMQIIQLGFDEEDTLRGWLLLKAEQMQPGQGIADYKGTPICLGKTADGRVLLRDHRGDWPPPRTIFE